MMGAKFEIGRLVTTIPAHDVISFGDMRDALARYLRCDWGDSCAEDKAQNDEAVKNGDRIVAVYHDSWGTEFWIITEWDRSVTTVLLPEDY